MIKMITLHTETESENATHPWYIIFYYALTGFRKDEAEWCKYMAAKSKRDSMVHILEVQHMKEQNAKGLQFLDLSVLGSKNKQLQS